MKGLIRYLKPFKLMSTSPIAETIIQGDIEQVKNLLEHQPEQVFQGRGPQGESLLVLALYHGHLALADLLRQRSPALSIHEAAATGDLEAVRQLLASRPDLVNAFSGDGYSPLHLACFFHQPEVARYLVDQGAEVSAPSANGQHVRPLHSAAAARSSELVALLLEKGADINAAQANGFTALHAAAHQGDEVLIKMLLERGADINAIAHDGTTPMEQALRQGHEAAKWFSW